MRKLILMVLFAGVALGQDRQQRSVLFHWENDSLGSIAGQSTDENYTNGLRLDIGSPGEHAWARHLESLYCGAFGLCGEKDRRLPLVSYGFTHQFYTPARIQLSAPQPRDRQWAGVMYLSGTLELNDGELKQHVFEGRIGILGQGAGAQYLQSRWHQFIGYPVQPAGWHNQLKNEPLINVQYTYNRRFAFDSNQHADAIVSPGVTLGTLTTYPSLGATVRIGHQISGFPVKPIGVAAHATERPSLEFYLMGGADGRFVVNNATLDGGFFNDGPKVDRKSFVRDLRVGWSIRYESLRITYNLVMRSPEFSTRRNVNQNFHSLGIGWEPRRWR